MKRIFEINENLFQREKINVFYGTGEKSKERLNALISQNFRCDFIGDNNPEVWNTKIENLHCISHDEIKVNDHINLIIGSKVYEKEIEKRMLEFGIPSNRIFYDNYMDELGDQIILGEGQNE